MKDCSTKQTVRNKHFAPSVLAGFSEAFVTGKFCDVKVVCKDTNLWAHRLVLGSVSPFLHRLLVEFERRGDDVITIFLPLIKGYHMKLVLDYIYSGAMYLCGAHMQYVIQVMEVLQLKCGVSVNKMVYSGDTEKGQGGDNWIEIEHSTMTIKTDNKEEKNETVSVNGHATPENGDSHAAVSDSTVDGGHCKTVANKRKNSTDQIKSSIKSRSKRKKQHKVVLNHVDDSKVVEMIVDHIKIDPESKSVDKSFTEKEVSLILLKVPEQTEVVSKDPVEKQVRDTSERTDPVKATVIEKDISDDDNDVVMVELDEEFVVEQLSGSGGEGDLGEHHGENVQAEVIGEQAAPSHRCILCGRTFHHYMNLQVHLTGHLGVKVNINRCAACKRNFRNKNELDLHMRSHRFARMLGKFRTKATKHNMVKKARVITTAGSKDKKIIRKYVKKRDLGVVTKEIYKSKGYKKVENLTCGLCDKSFGVKSLFLRHIQKTHAGLAETLSSHTMLQALPQVKIKKVKVPAISLQSQSPKSKRTPTSPIKFFDSDNPTTGRFGTPNRTFATPLSKGKEMLKSVVNSGKKKERTKSDSVAPELPDYYNTLECPDCDRVFIAKSIFERHLQSAKHGIYSMYSSYDSDHIQSPPSSTPSFWRSPLASSDSPSPREKIECHLCGQTFVRIRDLAKHREKMCQAYHSGKH